MAKLGENVGKLGEKVIIYGAPKTGKTLLAGQLAKSHKLKWVDIENGSATLLQLPKAWQSNIEVAQIPDTPRNPYAVEALLHMFSGRKGYVCDEHGKWNCPRCKGSKDVVHFDINTFDPEVIYVVDSLSQASASATNQIAKVSNMDFTLGDKFEWDHWGRLGQILERLLTDVQNCPANVVFISHEQEIEQEDGKEKLTPSGGTRNFARKIPKFFGHVVRTDLKNGKHTVVSTTADARQFISGSRLSIDAKSSGLESIFEHQSTFSAGKTGEPEPDLGDDRTETAAKSAAGSALDRLRARKNS